MQLLTAAGRRGNHAARSGVRHPDRNLLTTHFLIIPVSENTPARLRHHIEYRIMHDSLLLEYPVRILSLVETVFRQFIHGYEGIFFLLVPYNLQKTIPDYAEKICLE